MQTAPDNVLGCTFEECIDFEYEGPIAVCFQDLRDQVLLQADTFAEFRSDRSLPAIRQALVEALRRLRRLYRAAFSVSAC